jgi:hypothetical protein
MKSITTLFFALILTFSLSATELNYKWKADETYRFQANVTDDITMSMNMMGMRQSNTDQFKTTTTFSLKINRVDAAGKADAVLFVEAFEVKDSKGNLLASLKDIPANAVKTDVTVDAKGHFEWVKKVTMLLTDEGPVLVSGSATENSVSASGQAGNTKVEVYAEFDPKTGSLKAGYSVSEVAQTKTKTVKVTQDTPEIDILPYAFLELMALPEGRVSQGDELNAQVGQLKTAIKATSVSNGLAVLNISMATDKSASATKSSMSGKSGDDMGMDMDFDMDMDMDGFDDGFGGGMAPEEKAMMQGSMQSMPDMTADITSRFNYERGMFVNLSGTVNTAMNTMGMKVESKSVLEMKEL